MTKALSTDNSKHSFTVSLEIVDDPSMRYLSLECELGGPSGTIAEIGPDFYPYAKLSREKIKHRIDYISQHLDAVLSDALTHLWNESNIATEHAKGELKTTAKVRETLKNWRAKRARVELGDGWTIPERLDSMSSAARARLGLETGQGGARRTKETLATDRECEEFVRIVDAIHPNWKSIVKFFRRETDSRAVNWVKEENFFIKLTGAFVVPGWLLQQAFERKKRETQRRQDRRPIKRKQDRPKGLAYMHAFGFMYPKAKLPGYSTLEAAYAKGSEPNKTPHN